MVVIRFHTLHLDRYNSLFKARVPMWSGGPRVHLINACRSALHPIRRILLSHVSCKVENTSEHSPTRIKLKRDFGLKGVTDVRVSLNSDYGMLICTITLILRVYINIHATCHLRAMQALAWARLALPRGLACHVAPTWILHENKPLFCFIFICFNHLK